MGGAGPAGTEGLGPAAPCIDQGPCVRFAPRPPVLPPRLRSRPPAPPESPLSFPFTHTGCPCDVFPPTQGAGQMLRREPTQAGGEDGAPQTDRQTDRSPVGTPTLRPTSREAQLLSHLSGALFAHLGLGGAGVCWLVSTGHAHRPPPLRHVDQGGGHRIPMPAARLQGGPWAQVTERGSGGQGTSSRSGT